MSIDTKTKTLRDLLDQHDQLAARIEAAREDLTKAVQARHAEPAPGSKIIITVVFKGSPDEYEYLAMRTKNRRGAGANWYVTGQKGKLTWDDVLRLVERGTYRVEPLRAVKPSF